MRHVGDGQPFSLGNLTNGGDLASDQSLGPEVNAGDGGQVSHTCSIMPAAPVPALMAQQRRHPSSQPDPCGCQRGP